MSVGAQRYSSELAKERMRNGRCNDLPPRGRSVAMEVNLSLCCEEHRYDKANTRHLWRVAELDES